MAEWISIDERLPEDQQRCLVFDGSEVVIAKFTAGDPNSIGYGREHDWELEKDPDDVLDQPLCWMPIPDLTPTRRFVKVELREDDFGVRLIYQGVLYRPVV